MDKKLFNNYLFSNLDAENNIEAVSQYASLMSFSFYLYPFLFAQNIKNFPVDSILPSTSYSIGSFSAEIFTLFFFLCTYVTNYIPFIYFFFDQNASKSFVVYYSINYFIITLLMREGMLLQKLLKFVLFVYHLV